MSDNKQETILIKRNDYEVTVIYSSREDDYQESQKKVEELFQELDIRIISQNDLGTKEFAYPMLKHTHGHYYVYLVNAPANSIKKFVKEVGLTEKIIRHMIIHIDKKARIYYDKVEKKEKEKKAV